MEIGGPSVVDLPTGYEESIFVHKNQLEILEVWCPICLGVARNCVQTPCGHLFCEGCIERHLMYKADCPVDHYPLTHCQVMPDQRSRRMVLNLRIKCPNSNQITDPLDPSTSDQQCIWTGLLRDLPEHLDTTCCLRSTRCEYAKFGCKTELPAHEMEEHMKKNADIHLLMLKEGYSQLESVVEKMKNEFKEPCPNCNTPRHHIQSPPNEPPSPQRQQQHQQRQQEQQHQQQQQQQQHHHHQQSVSPHRGDQNAIFRYSQNFNLGSYSENPSFGSSDASPFGSNSGFTFESNNPSTQSSIFQNVPFFTRHTLGDDVPPHPHNFTFTTQTTGPGPNSGRQSAQSSRNMGEQGREYVEETHTFGGFSFGIEFGR